MSNLTNPMTKGIYQGLIPVLDTNGNQIGLRPNIGGTVTFSAAGTTNAQAVFTDPQLTVPYPSHSNVVSLNSWGYAVIYLSPIAYKYVEADSFGNPVFYQDNFNGGTSFGSTGFADNIADLKLVDTNTDEFIYVAGYYTPGDGGEGSFYNKTSSTADDGGYAIQSTFDPSKVWFRIPDEDGNVRAASFGFIPSNAGDQTAQLMAADAYAASIFARLLIQGGGAATVNTMTFVSRYVSHAANGVFNSAATLKFNGTYEADSEEKFGPLVTVVFSTSQVSYATWFGFNTASPDNTTVAARWVAAGGGTLILPPDAWNYANPTTFPWPQVPVILQGTLVGTSVTYPVGLRLPDLSNIRLNKIILQNGIILGNFSTTGFQVNGDFNVTGNQTVVGSILAQIISSNTTLNAQTNVIAGLNVEAGTNGSGGYLLAQAGVGSQYFKASGRFPPVLGAGNTTIPANTLIAIGDSLSCVITGSIISGTSILNVQVAFGSLNLSSGPLFAGLKSGAAHWVAIVNIRVTGTNTVFMDGALTVDNLDAVASNNCVRVTSTTASLVLTTPNDIAVTVTGNSGGGGAQTSQLVTFFPI